MPALSPGLAYGSPAVCVSGISGARRQNGFFLTSARIARPALERCGNLGHNGAAMTLRNAILAFLAAAALAAPAVQAAENSSNASRSSSQSSSQSRNRDSNSSQNRNAHTHNDQDDARAALREGKVMPLTAILEIAMKRERGTVLEVELERENGLLKYEIEILGDSGRKVQMWINARSGEILKVRYP
jgi:uncharacterized membrane protein YkoI